MTSDEKTLEETGVKEGDFFVVTVTVVKVLKYYLNI
jgi:hypothetical protein